jgi:hypothetical protein
MKAQAANRDVPSGAKKAPAAQVTTAEYPAVGEEVDAELEPEDLEAAEDDAEDVFKEIPTEANRPNPMAGPAPIGPDGAAPAAPPEGAGAYRLLRPTTSDVLDTPAPAKPETGRNKGLVIGSARKR